MSEKILVAYASRYGATQGIADAIGNMLTERGFEVDVRNAEDVGGLNGYTVIVLGSAVYSGDWLEPAVELLESFKEQLAEVPVWLFSSGPTMEGDPSDIMGGWLSPASLQTIVDAINPKDIKLFAGKIDADKLEMEDWLINRSMRGETGDYRNWSAIRAWAGAIADGLVTTQALEPKGTMSD